MIRKRLAYLLRSWAMKLDPTVWDDCLTRVLEADEADRLRRMAQIGYGYGYIGGRYFKSTDDNG